LFRSIFNDALTILAFCSCCNLSTQVLGKVACRLLSALLGIGIAERSWGAVKQLKSGNRSNLGAEAVRMQATIFGAACIEKARMLKQEKEHSMELWNDDDVEFQLGLENFEADEASDGMQRFRRASPRRLFHAWREDWEKVACKTNDLVHETKLLRKYANLRWLDPDTKRMFVCDPDNLEWHRSGGWCAIGTRDDGTLEPWPLKLLPSLIKKTKQETVLNVEIVHLSQEERAKRKAAREAAASAGKGKRKRNDSDSDNDDSDSSDPGDE
jgi:hypothetical protein